MAQGQPVFILPENISRMIGRDAQRNNIMAARLVAETVKSTLGPRGMDKMLVDSIGDITVTNDGVTILEEMQIEHPAAKMMVEIAKTQEAEVGDGTTTAVVIAGELLKNAEKLLDQDIHPTVVARGYRLASEQAIKVLHEISTKIDRKDRALLVKIAATAITGKGAESARDMLAELIVDSVLQVSEGNEVDLDSIKIEKKKGKSISQSELIKGIVLDKERVHPDMPKRVENAKIALLDCALEIKGPETDTKVSISSPDQLQAFLDQEEKMLKGMVEKVKKSGANVVFCQKGIDDIAQHFLAKEGIMAVRRVKKSDMNALARATGGKVVSRVKDLSSSDLGKANTVVERKIAGDDMVFVEGCKNPKAVSLLVRGGSEHVVDEAERAVVDAIGSTSSALRDGKVVAGGGASEIEVSLKLREFAKTVGGREQLAIECFAETLEEIPRTLAETAGMDPIDTLVSLRSKHSSAGGKYIGVNVFKAYLDDMKKLKVIEPLGVKIQAVTSASEVAEMLLRIDDIIAGSSKGKAGAMPHGGMPPGMGEMDM